jgi:hypothetical protein
MRQGLRRLRAAIVMGVLWALIWGPAAILLGTLVIDPDNSMDEMWVMIGAIPGFLTGVIFSAVLGIAARERPLEALSTARVGGWGALAGVVIGVLPFLLGDTSGGALTWVTATTIVASITLLSAVSAAGSLLIAKQGAQRELAPPRDRSLPGGT